MQHVMSLKIVLRMVKLSSAEDIAESTGCNSHVICASIPLSQFAFLSLNYVVLQL